MPPPQDTPWRPIALGLMLFGLTGWGLWIAPPSRLVGSTRVFAATIFEAHRDTPPTCWDMDLRLDPAVRPPGPAWILHEGRRPGEGYDLRWLPDRRILQVHRALPTPALLGSVRLDRLPSRLGFTRRGGELTVRIDGRQVLRCLDPAPPAPGSRRQERQWWGALCTTGGDLRESILSVQLAPLASPRWGSDGDPGTGPEETLRRRADHSFLRVRGALAAVATHDPQTPVLLGAATAALGVARTDLGSLAGGPVLGILPGVTEADRSRTTSADDRVRLAQWLALARVEWWLGQVDREPTLDPDTPLAEPLAHGGEVLQDPQLVRLDRARDAIGDLMDLGQHAANPEYPGMLLSLVPRLARSAVELPHRADDPHQVAERRRRWLDLLAAVTETAAQVADDHLGEEDRQLLALIRQACACWGGSGQVRQPLPLAVDAPHWMAVRWRLLAGDDPGSDDLPPLPEGSSGLAPAVEGFIGTGLDLPRRRAAARSETALLARERALRKGKEGLLEVRRAEEEAAGIKDDPLLTPRDRTIGLAAVALNVGRSRPGLLLDLLNRLAPPETLRTRSQTPTPARVLAHPDSYRVLAEKDPLAWACLRLLVRRHPEVLVVPADPDATERLKKQIDALRPPDEYATLLSGQASAASWVWLVRLPPAEALAAALAAQEAAVPRESTGALPDWSLLDEVPNLGLPLRLLKPRDDQAPGDLDTP